MDSKGMNKNDLLTEISQQNEKIRILSEYLESEKAKLSKMTLELEGIQKITYIKQSPVMDYPRIYEPLRF